MTGKCSSIGGDAFFFPAEVCPHTDFLPKHVFIMATVKRALARGFPGLRILEVGSWVGASALLWAESIRHFGGLEAAGASSVLSVDSWAPILSSEDMEFGKYRQFAAAAANDLAYNIFRHNSRLGQARFGVAMDHLRGRSEDVLPELEAGSFDIVYVDASHYYDDVVIDVVAARNLVKAGGVVCGDDHNLSLDQVDQEAARASLNRDFVQDPRTGQYFHPGVTLAVGEAFGPVGTCGGFWSVDKLAPDHFRPTEIGFEGAFMPSFLTPDEQSRFASDINLYFPGAFPPA